MNFMEEIKILLADIEPNLHAEITRLTNSGEYTYRFITSGYRSDDLVLRHSEEIDLFICGMVSGKNKIKELLKQRADLPVIIISEKNDAENIAELLKLGAAQYLIKDNSKNYLNILPVYIEHAFRNKKADKKLQILSQAVTSINECIYISDLTGKIFYINEAFSKVYGYTPPEMFGKSRSVLWHEDSMEIYRLNKHLEAYKGEVFHKKKNGEKFPVYLSRTAIQNNYGTVIASVGITTDITERKKTEADLLHHRESLAEAQRMASLGNWDWDLIKNQASWSDEVNKIFGYTGEEKINLTYEQLLSHVHPDDTKRIQESVERVIKNKISLSMDCRITAADNKNKTIHMKFDYAADEAGNPRKVLGTIQDITTRKKLEVELKEVINDKDKFFSIISHDLKSPIHSIVAFSEILLNEYNTLTEPEKKDFIKYTYDASVQVYNLTHNLLQWAMLQRGRVDFNPENFRIWEEADNLILLLKSQLLKKNLEIVNSSDSGHFIYADRNMIRSVLQNLITNAIKFSEAGKTIIISSKALKDQIQVSVKDNGIGLSKEDLNKLFRIDVYFSNKGTADENGTGIGLILCKEQVDLNGGKIWAESELGKGTIFHFTLPVKKIDK
jgi:PAS domain S-box-containing protein